MASPNSKVSAKKKAPSMTTPNTQPPMKLEHLLLRVAPACEHSACETIDYCIGEAIRVIETKRIATLAQHSCCYALARELAIALRLANLRRDTGSPPKDGGSTIGKESLESGAEPIPARIDRHAGNKILSRSAESISCRTVPSSALNTVPEVPSSPGMHADRDSRPTSSFGKEHDRGQQTNFNPDVATIALLFATADERGVGWLTIPNVQSFLLFHGHGKLAPASVLRAQLTNLEIDIAAPIKLPHFIRYIQHIVKCDPAVEFSAYALPSEPIDEQEEKEVAELQAILKAQAQRRGSMKLAVIRNRLNRALGQNGSGSNLPESAGGRGLSSKNDAQSVVAAPDKHLTVADGVARKIGLIQATLNVVATGETRSPGGRPHTASAGQRQKSANSSRKSGTRGGLRPSTAAPGGSSNNRLKFMDPDPAQQPSIASDKTLVIGAGVTMTESVAENIVAKREGGKLQELPNKMSKDTYKTLAQSGSAIRLPTQQRPQTALPAPVITSPERIQLQRVSVSESQLKRVQPKSAHPSSIRSPVPLKSPKSSHQLQPTNTRKLHSASGASLHHQPKYLSRPASASIIPTLEPKFTKRPTSSMQRAPTGGLVARSDLSPEGVHKLAPFSGGHIVNEKTHSPGGFGMAKQLKASA